MKNKQFTIGALFSYGAIIFNILSGLLYTPWMIRIIGDDQYALYTLAISVINLFMMDFGIGAAVSKFLSNYYANGQHKEADRFMGIVYRVFIIISVVIAACLFILYFFLDIIYVKLTADELRIFKHLFIIVATYSVLSFPFTTFNGILMANERFIAVKACNFFRKVLNVALIVTALLANMGVYALVLVNAVSNIVFILIKYICIRRQTALSVEFSYKDRKLTHELFGFSIWITVINLAQRCIFNIMPSVIAALVNSAEVTLFSLAASLEGYVYTFAEAINGMFLPRISRLIKSEQTQKELPTLMSNVGRFHVATLGLIYIGFLCLGTEFVDLWMGVGYKHIYVCALLLIFPSMIDVPQQVARTALLAKDIVKEQALVYVGMALINLLLSFLFVPMWGAGGAAVSVCVAYLFRTFAFNILYSRKLKINLSVYFREAYGRWTVAAGIALVFGAVISKMGQVGWMDLFVKVVMLIGVYGIAYICTALKKEERKSIVHWLRRNT